MQAVIVGGLHPYYEGDEINVKIYANTEEFEFSFWWLVLNFNQSIVEFISSDVNESNYD